jgi:PAT family beta-lactamase induction signal transducer AmpG
MQLLISAALFCVGVSIQTMAFFAVSLGIFWIMAFSSSTHDIAADGFYMLALDKHGQTWWNGIRSTFYRIATIVGSGLLIVFAGVLENKGGLAPQEIQVTAKPEAKLITEVNPASITVSPQEGELKLIAQPANVEIALTNFSAEDAKALISKAKKWNLEHGFSVEERPMPKTEKGWWTLHISEPLGDFLKRSFPKRVNAKPSVAGSIGVTYFTLSKEPPAGKDIIVGFGKKLHGAEYIGFGAADFTVKEGERFVFNSTNWNVPAIAVIQTDAKLKASTSATYMTRSGNIPQAWCFTLLFLGGLFLAICAYHNFVLPKPVTDIPVGTGKNMFADFFGTLGSYFRKPGIIPALAFILLYRFPEAQGVTMIGPFLLDTRDAGGLGLTTGQFGFIYGTIGILALTAGGLIGSFFAAKHGLKTMLPIMVCAIHLPNAAFLYLSQVQPESFAAIGSCIAIEQFGYGFGFSAYMLFLLYFSDGPSKTAHYAVCTSLMAWSMLIPRMWSGWLTDLIGYQNFFVWVMVSTIPGFLVAFLIKIDPHFGKKADVK